MSDWAQRGAGDDLRREIAVSAARLIADGGLDYGSAKRKAARQVLGTDAPPRGAMPDNEDVDVALREHLELFDEGHAQRVDRMRRVALRLMRRLADFQPYLTGAVWKGIVAEHAPIHLQLFHDDGKDVAIFLLNDGIAFEPIEVPHFRNDRRVVEALTFEWQAEPVMLSLYAHDDLRGALRPGRAVDGSAAIERGSIEQLSALLEDDPR